MVCATVALIMVITKTPKKLKTAAMMIAGRGPIARVEIQVAIAFGASVQPLTRITPKVNTDVTKSAGADTSCSRNSSSETVILSLLCFYRFQQKYFFPFYVNSI